jgi:hypothetical protein
VSEIGTFGDRPPMLCRFLRQARCACRATIKVRPVLPHPGMLPKFRLLPHQNVLVWMKGSADTVAGRSWSGLRSPATVFRCLAHCGGNDALEPAASSIIEPITKRLAVS